MKYIFSLLFFFVSLFSLYSCTEAPKNDYPAINIERLDVDLYRFLQNPSKENEVSLKFKYGNLLGAFGSIAVNESNIDDPNFFPSLQNYFSNTDLLKIYNDEQQIFRDINSIEEEISKANNLISEHFNELKLPKLSIHVSGFKENTIVTSDVISISADKYLGSDYPIYRDFFDDYQRISMQPQMITRNYLRAWLLSEFPQMLDRKNVLSEIIHEGKILYTLSVLLPDWKEADLIGYTAEQTEWSKSNEKSIWAITTQKKYLYSNDSQVIGKYINEAPYTVLISPESPGRIGAWLGWQIIKSYVKNTRVSLDQLYTEKDIQKTLKLSKYNP